MSSVLTNVVGFVSGTVLGTGAGLVTSRFCCQCCFWDYGFASTVGETAAILVLNDSEFSTAMKAGIFVSSMFLNSFFPTSLQIAREIFRRCDQVEQKREEKSIAISLLAGTTVGLVGISVGGPLCGLVAGAISNRLVKHIVLHVNAA